MAAAGTTVNMKLLFWKNIWYFSCTNKSSCCDTTEEWYKYFRIPRLQLFSKYQYVSLKTVQYSINIIPYQLPVAILESIAHPCTTVTKLQS